MFGRRIAMVALAPALVVACGEAGGDREPAQSDGNGPTWTSELQYKIGDAVEGDALFYIIRTVRVGRDGERVFVTDPGLSRVSVWTPDGRLLVSVGQSGDGPGDLASPTHVYPHDSGFLVRERRRFSHFSADGELETTSTFPGNVSYEGFQISMEGLLADGSFLGRPWISASVELGLWGDDPIETLPLLRIAESGAGWSQRTLVRQNDRNWTLWYELPNGNSFSVQPFSDADQYESDPVAGTFVFARNVGEGLRAGEAEILDCGDRRHALAAATAVRSTPARGPRSRRSNRERVGRCGTPCGKPSRIPSRPLPSRGRGGGSPFARAPAGNQVLLSDVVH